MFLPHRPTSAAGAPGRFRHRRLRASAGSVVSETRLRRDATRAESRGHQLAILPTGVSHPASSCVRTKP